MCVTRLKAQFHKWMGLTTLHGVPDILEDKRLLWKLFWVLNIILMTGLAIFSVYPLVIAYYEKEFYTQTIVGNASHKEDFGVILYCSDDWLNLTKVFEQKVSFSGNTALRYVPIHSRNLNKYLS